ncbi:MAG: sensor domain-containing diguanylate cyclase [Bradyrhizobium sp.]
MSDQTDTRRLQALAELDILDTPHELAFDRLTLLSRKIFRVPMATLTFVDGHRQWFKASEGMDSRETSRQPALCYHAIRQKTPLVVPDTLLDPRFADNPFVVGKPHIRAYAGAQLQVSGENVGTLCVIDTVPRQFDDEAISVLMDLAAIAVDELTLRNLSMVDGLTGALSRRAFLAEGARLTSLAARHGHKLTCSVLDIDHFKNVNDEFGHAAGDAVLSAVIAACKKAVRGSDLIGRIGGEEFAILLPHTGLRNGMAVLEKVRNAIAATPIPTPAGDISVTCSIGGAEFSKGQQFADTLGCADVAMYSAKQGGRNQSIAWIETAPSLAPAQRRVLKAGQISFNSGRSVFECTVRALSDDAATLDVISTADVPDTFKLRITVDDFSRACRVVARKEKKVEVAFL